MRTVQTAQRGRVDEERLIYEPSSFHERGEITEENWQKMKRRVRLADQSVAPRPRKKRGDGPQTLRSWNGNLLSDFRVLAASASLEPSGQLDGI